MINLDIHKEMLESTFIFHEYSCEYTYSSYLAECASRGIEFDAVCEQICFMLNALNTGCPKVAFDILLTSDVIDDELKAGLILMLVRSNKFPPVFFKYSTQYSVFDNLVNDIDFSLITDNIKQYMSLYLQKFKMVVNSDGADSFINIFIKWLIDDQSLTYEDISNLYNNYIIGNTVFLSLFENRSLIKSDFNNINFSQRLPSGSINELLGICAFCLYENSSLVTDEFINSTLKVSISNDLTKLQIVYLTNEVDNMVIININNEHYNILQDIKTKLKVINRKIYIDNSLIYDRIFYDKNPEIDRLSICKILSDLCKSYL